MSKKINLGFCFTGSFCTFSEMMPILKDLSKHYDLYPIMSFNSAQLDTRFGKTEDFQMEIEEICKRPILKSIPAVEPIGPKGYLDALVIAPCTGNTLAKVANGISDTPASLCFKSHLRNQKPVILAVSSNDALSGNAKNIGLLMNAKNVYFAPMGQDDPMNKPTSVVADFSLIHETVQEALKGKQLQPILKNQ